VSRVLNGAAAAPVDSTSLVAWLTALIGFFAMFGPVYWWAAQSIWQSDEQSHGALVLVVAAWLFWSLRKRLADIATQPVPALGWPIFSLGVVVYLAGQGFDIAIFKLGSQPLVIAGALLLMKGFPALRLAWFPLFYLIFMIPLPATLVDAVTGPLKQWISDIVENVLHAAGYPIAREGVTMTIGQYELLVADACSGLNSMFSLSALGTLYIYLTGRKGLLHNVVMLASILPIAFLANIIRVVVLVLITYHFGDEAGQGFLHGAAGLVLNAVALCTFFLLDTTLAPLWRRAEHSRRAA
jgi:exosortase B